MKTLLYLLLFLTLPVNSWSAGLTMTWPDTASLKILSRSTTSDSISMVPQHIYNVTATLSTNERSATQTVNNSLTYATANVSLSVIKSDLGQYFGAGTHFVDCPQNMYDNYVNTAASIVTTGISASCFIYQAGTCRRPTGQTTTYGDYKRIDFVDANVECFLACQDNTYLFTVAQPAWTGLQCLPNRNRYILWTRTLGLYKCFKPPQYPNGAWWGEAPCDKCEDKEADCTCA